MAQLSGVSLGSCDALRDDVMDVALHSKHKVFLSHSGFQKDFVEQLCVDLERCDRYPFLDKRLDSLPIGENFPQHIFDAIQQCHVGVVILSNEFFTCSKWPMIELVAMVKEAKVRKLSFKIMPIFLRTSIDEFRDPVKRNQWLSCWHELALEDKRVNVGEWEDALKYLHPVNSLVYDGLGEVRFRKVIVDEICKVVPPETRLEDSHIQGRSRICKVIQEKINAQQNGKNHEVCVVGLYGMGDIGKTCICKALCNEFFTEFHGRVCHAELERKSIGELMREVLKKVTDTSLELLDGWNVDELLKGLNGGIIKEAIFLALDNVSDTQASINEAKSYLSASLPPGSIVMVTSRTKGTLMLVRPYVDENNCLEMPELDVEEAKSLFTMSSHLELRSEVHEQLIMRCIKSCHFQKNDGSGSYHYHPLTLDVLGKQLGCMDPKEWKTRLDKIDEDNFNQSRETNHPIFSILRKSFDALSPEDQLLFMDVALFLPTHLHQYSHERVAYKSMFEWLGMVHRTSVDDLMRGLERLKRKSLLERLGDGIETSIGMHDLWRAFCVEESQSGELRCRRWVYGAKKSSELVESSPSGSCWENVKRMAFFGSELRSWERVNFAHFANVTVLKTLGLSLTKTLVLDLSGLIHLKSFELTGEEQNRLVVLEGLPRSILFLTLRSSHEQFVKQVGCLTELQHLHLIRYSGRKLPDMRSMISLRVAIFFGCKNVDTLTGLGSKLSNLRVLDLGQCRKLRSCPGVGDLVNLEELNCRDCGMLARLPNLRKLRNLRRLDVSRCPLINEVPGLGDLVALEELYAGTIHSDCTSYSIKLPDMRKLSNLRVLRLHECRLKAVPGFDSLVSLQEVEADFREVVDRPKLRPLTKLQKLTISGWSSGGLGELHNLAMFHTLDIRYCSGVDKLPDFRSLVHLETLSISECEFKDVSGLSNLSALERLGIRRCPRLERLPALQGHSRLKWLKISNCPMLRAWDCTVGQIEGSSCRIDDTRVGYVLSDSQRLTGLRALELFYGGLSDVTIIGGFSQLESLSCYSLAVRELPDLSNFPRLKTLYIYRCRSLRRLTSREPIRAVSELELGHCSSLTTLPDLCTFPGLVKLELWGCEGIATLSSTGPLTALQLLDLNACSGLAALPDLCNFPGLVKLELWRCEGITTLRISGPLTALQQLNLNDCSGLEALPDLGMFPALKKLRLKGCRGLTALSISGPLTALQLLNLDDCSGVKELPDLCNFPGLVKLELWEHEGITTLSISGPLTALQHLNLNDCSGLAALPDLGMFPALEKLLLEGCSGLTTLSSRVPLPVLKVLDARGCRSLNRDDLDQLRASCPQCEIKCDALDVHVKTGVAKTWMVRAVGAGGVTLALGWMFRALRSRSRARKH